MVKLQPVSDILIQMSLYICFNFSNIISTNSTTTTTTNTIIIIIIVICMT